MIIGPTIWAAKSAILALYIRVFGPVQWLRITSYGLIVFMFLFYWSNIAISGAYCIPRGDAPWNAATFARCAEPSAHTIVVGVLDVATDLVIYLLPFPIINKLQLAPKKRFGLQIVFLIGFIAVIGAVASLAYKIEVFLGNDPLWNGIAVAITTFVEVHLTVIVSCAPALSSFWINIVTGSKWYSSLRSGASSWALHSKDRKVESTEDTRKAIYQGTVSSTPKGRHTYNELDDDASDHVKTPSPTDLHRPPIPSFVGIMFDDFVLRHIPPLLVATALTFGGLMPFFNAEHAIQEFGLPKRIAISKPAQSIMIVSSARITAIGIALFTFYFQGKFEAVDTILLILGYVGLVDGYVCWLEGVPGKAVFRTLSGTLIAAWGWYGMTLSR
ncbi:MAG: hypothetical protein Q9169_006099 [Polycauliona sp. 2 TL-2023]